MSKHSFSIYDASAGSGKTYALVKEYLKIILTAAKNDAYRNILAITFTNKAVHEMKSRIVGNLSEFAKETPSEKALDLMKDLSIDTNLSLNDIQEKSKSIIKHIIHNYAAFDISTIDKFTHKVIRAFAHDLGLPMTFEVSLDTENLLTEAVDALIAQAGTDEVLTKLLIDFTMEKTDDDKSWDISREILNTGRLILNENNREEITHLNNKSISEFVAIKEKLIAMCKTIEKDIVALAIETFKLIENNGIDVKSFSAGHFPNHIQGIIQGKYNPNNKRYFQPEDIKINKTAKDKAIIESIIPDLLNDLDKIYKNFSKRDFYKAFLKNITPLSLLNTVSNELTKIQTEQNILSISEFNAIIFNEIQNQPAPFIYERLGERYRHFFIDEFQDTSEMQWHNLIPLIDNALSGQDDLGQKGTLMIVGDPKQSIYRWRGGKAEQFIDLSKDWNPFNNPDKNLVHLDKNYRSYSQIIEFNNDFFKFLSSEFTNIDYKDLYENHSHQKTNSKQGGYVNLSFIPKSEKNDFQDIDDNSDKESLYLLSTLNTIQKVKKQGFEYKDIVILTRKRSQGIAVANYLTEQNIPILSSETLMIQNASEVALIINVLKYLNNNADTEAKVHFLYYLANNVQDKLGLHDFITQGKMLVNETEFEQWLLKFGISFSFKDIQKKSLYEIVETIVNKMLYVHNSSEITTNAYVQYFLDIVLERDVRYQASISDFLSYWDRKSDSLSIPSPEGKNAVRIMTIHKSKGLEFPVVIMPFADENYARSPKNKLWLNTEEEEFGLPKVLIDNNTAVATYSDEAAIVYDQKKQEDLLDNINVLYVALTRAEEQLYLISQIVEPNKEGNFPYTMAGYFMKFLSFNQLYEAEKTDYSFGNPLKLSESIQVIEQTNEIPYVANLLDFKEIKIAKKEALMWGSNQESAIAYGNVIHEILSYIKTKNDIDLAITKSLENGLIVFSQEETVRKTIRDILNHDDLQSFFDSENEVFNEQLIIQKEGKAIKPDRMVVTPSNEVLLLDYKTGAFSEKHQLQLEQYQYAIENMNYIVVKKALIYIGEQINIVNL